VAVEAGVQVVADSVGIRKSDRSVSNRQLHKVLSYSFITNRSRVTVLIEGSTMNIYVGNLSLETTTDELRKEFTKFGEVLSVTVMNDEYIGSGQPRGYGYVEMVSHPEGVTAITNLDGKILKDRVINVVESLPLSHKSKTDSINMRAHNRFNKNRERRHITN